MILLTVATALVPPLAAYCSARYAARTDTIHKQVHDLRQTIITLEI